MHYIIFVFLFFQSLLIKILTQGSLMADVLKQYVQGLEELDTHVASGLLTQDVQEEGKHVLLQEEAEQIHTRVYTQTHSIHDDLILKLNYQKEEYFSLPASWWTCG